MDQQQLDLDACSISSVSSMPVILSEVVLNQLRIYDHKNSCGKDAARSHRQCIRRSALMQLALYGIDTYLKTIVRACESAADGTVTGSIGSERPIIS